MNFLKASAFKYLFFFAAVLIFAFSGRVSAQTVATPASIPTAADPSRIVTSTPDVIQQSKAVTNEATQTGGGYNDILIPGADQVKFYLSDIDIVGVTAYPQSDLADLKNPLLGREVSLQDVITMTNKLNRKYRDDGYIFARAFLPEQDITEGHVRVEAVEDYVNNVQVENPVHPNSMTVATIADQMRANRPFNVFTFERQVLRLNELNGSSFRSLLKPPAMANTAPGGIDVVLIESKQSSVNQVSFDNYGSKYAGPTEASYAFVKNYSFVPYDELSLQLFGTMPGKELRYFQTGYALPVAILPGLKATTSYSVGATKAGSNLEPLDIKGNVHEGKIGLGYVYPLDRVKKVEADLNLDVKTATSKILGEPLYKDKLRVIRASLGYQGQDRWNGASSITGEYSHGLEILGAKPDEDTLLSRADGRPDFGKFTLNCTRLQNVVGNWQVFGQAQGQYTMQPLLSSEEFGFGGGGIGRGYDPSEITGDHGLGTSFEIRYNKQTQSNIIGLQLAQPFLFTDFGKVWQKGDSTTKPVSAWSAGFGSRFYLEKGINANLTFAWPLTLSAGNPPNYSSEDGVRVLFSLGKSF